MKKFMVPLVIASLISGAAFAQTTNVVSSANVVGYNSIAVLSNVYTLVALSFSNAIPTVSNLFAALPTGSEVLLWDTATQKYKPAIGKTRAGWGVPGSNVVVVGSGAFIKVPAVTNVYLSGDVLMAPTTVLNTVSGKYTQLSFPYSADTTFTNTTLAKGAATSDEVSVWDGTNGWKSYGRTRAGWGAATNLQIRIGQAVLYKAVTNRVVNEAKPYTIQ